MREGIILPLWQGQYEERHLLSKARAPVILRQRGADESQLRDKVPSPE
jgi:hypothetical protein